LKTRSTHARAYASRKYLPWAMKCRNASRLKFPAARATAKGVNLTKTASQLKWTRSLRPRLGSSWSSLFAIEGVFDEDDVEDGERDDMGERDDFGERDAIGDLQCTK